MLIIGLLQNDSKSHSAPPSRVIRRTSKADSGRGAASSVLPSTLAELAPTVRLPCEPPYGRRLPVAFRPFRAGGPQRFDDRVAGPRRLGQGAEVNVSCRGSFGNNQKTQRGRCSQAHPGVRFHVMFPVHHSVSTCGHILRDLDRSGSESLAIRTRTFSSSGGSFMIGTFTKSGSGDCRAASSRT